MRVWFNRHFALVYRVLKLIREADAERRFTLLCSHKQPYFIGYAAADEHAVEPADLSGDDYVRWCLDFAVTHRVDVFAPAHEADALVAARAEFEARGIRVLAVADAATLPNLHDKGWVYREMTGRVALAASTVMRDLGELDSCLESLWSQELDACIKPTVSIYGKGFHRLMRPDEPLQGSRSLSVAQWRERYAADGICVPQQVLEYLPGHEFSVDCIGDKGRFVTGVVRKKSITTATQLLDDNPALLAQAAQLLERFSLSGLVNIQFKEDRSGLPKLLEINPRASGGVAMSCLSGINLPYIALCGALDGFDTVAIPEPRLGLRVTEVGSPVVLPNG